MCQNRTCLSAAARLKSFNHCKTTAEKHHRDRQADPLPALRRPLGFPHQLPVSTTLPEAGAVRSHAAREICEKPALTMSRRCRRRARYYVRHRLRARFPCSSFNFRVVSRFPPLDFTCIWMGEGTAPTARQGGQRRGYSILAQSSESKDTPDLF